MLWVLSVLWCVDRVPVVDFVLGSVLVVSPIFLRYSSCPFVGFVSRSTEVSFLVYLRMVLSPSVLPIQPRVIRVRGMTERLVRQVGMAQLNRKPPWMCRLKLGYCSGQAGPVGFAAYGCA